MTLLVKDTNLFMYADDQQLSVTRSDYNIVSSRLQNQGKLAMSWYRDNFLLANREKFQCFTINPRNIDSDKPTEALQIEDQIITNTSQIKVLGVEIDDKLNLTNHEGLLGGPCFLAPLQNYPMFPCSHTFSLVVPLLINLLTTYHLHQCPPAKKEKKRKRQQKQNF